MVFGCQIGGGGSLFQVLLAESVEARVENHTVFCEKSSGNSVFLWVHPKYNVKVHLPLFFVVDPHQKITILERVRPQIP